MQRTVACHCIAFELNQLQTISSSFKMDASSLCIAHRPPLKRVSNIQMSIFFKFPCQHWNLNLIEIYSSENVDLSVDRRSLFPPSMWFQMQFKCASNKQSTCPPESSNPKPDPESNISCWLSQWKYWGLNTSSRPCLITARRVVQCQPMCGPMSSSSCVWTNN